MWPKLLLFLTLKKRVGVSKEVVLTNVTGSFAVISHPQHILQMYSYLKPKNTIQLRSALHVHKGMFVAKHISNIFFGM